MKFTLDSSTKTIQFESFEDLSAAAAAILRLDSPAVGNQLENQAVKPTRPARSASPDPRKHENQDVVRVLQAMRDGPETGTPSEEIAGVLGYTNQQSLGPATKRLKRIMEEWNLDIDRVRVIRRTGRNGAFWKRGADFHLALQKFGMALAPSESGYHQTPPEHTGQQGPLLSEST